MKKAMIKISSKNVKIFIALIIIKILYIYLAVNILGNLWYQGYGSYGVDFNLSKEIVASVVFLIVSVGYVNMNSRGKFVDVLLRFLFIIYYIPINSAYSINNTSLSFFLLSNLYFVLILIFVSTFIKEKEATPTILYENYFDKKEVVTTCILICCLFIMYKIIYNGFHFSLSLENEVVYSTRAATVERLGSIAGSFLAYLITLITGLASYCAPLLILRGLVRKKGFSVFIGILCILSEFAISAGKGTLLFIPIVFYVFYMSKRGSADKYEKHITVSMLLLLIFCLALYFCGVTYIYILLVRRTMYLPSWLNTLYYDCFLGHNKLFLSDSAFIFQKFIPSVYDKGVLQIISETYFKGTIPSPNSGMFAEAYMQFGIVGVVLFPLLFALLLKWASRIIDNCGEAISFLLAVKVGLDITNVPMLRTDFVLSFILVVFLIGILQRVKIGNDYSERKTNGR